MSLVTCHMTISVDGFVAGPVQTREDPIGEGHRLHQWMFHADEPGHEMDAQLREQIVGGRGAFIMGRNMYGPIRGEWDEDWRGWWGEEPPYHAPVFVLTHYAHDPIEMAGGTTFHFVTDGFDAAYAQARAAAGDREISIAGGASAIRQALAAGVINEMMLDIAPVVLGTGESPFSGLRGLELEPLEVIHSPRASHVRYRVGGVN
jgi:dihydrofolate reductase